MSQYSRARRTIKCRRRMDFGGVLHHVIRRCLWSADQRPSLRPGGSSTSWATARALGSIQIANTRPHRLLRGRPGTHKPMKRQRSLLIPTPSAAS